MRLMKLGLAMLAACSLAACGVTGQISDPATAGAVGAAINATGAQAPAPLANPGAADVAIDIGVDAIELSLTALDLGIAAGKIKPGSPKALLIADLVDKARKGLNAADAARQSLSAKDYETAMRQASKAFTELKSAF